MKKEFIIVIIFMLLGAGVFIYNKNSKYIITYDYVDIISPYDVELSVYKNNKLIDVKSVKYLDGVILCYGENLTVNINDIKNESKLIIVLNNNKEVYAEVLKKN